MTPDELDLGLPAPAVKVPKVVEGITYAKTPPMSRHFCEKCLNAATLVNGVPSHSINRATNVRITDKGKAYLCVIHTAECWEQERAKGATP